ncbi:replication initiator protein A [Neisseria sp.]
MNYVPNIAGSKINGNISLEILRRKSGSMATLREFRRVVRSLVASNDLPDYRLTYDDKKDVLKVRKRDLSKFLKKSP